VKKSININELQLCYFLLWDHPSMLSYFKSFVSLSNVFPYQCIFHKCLWQIM
jgi:hypothetical protein